MDDKLTTLGHMRDMGNRVKTYTADLIAPFIESTITALEQMDEAKADKTPATQKENGLMSKDDKIKLDGVLTDEEADNIMNEVFGDEWGDNK